MAEMTTADLDEFLATPREGVLSVTLASGRAMGTPVWFLWKDGVLRFQSPTTTAKTAALRSTGRASLCVHEQALPMVRYVTFEGPVTEVEFDFEADIVAAAHHYLGDDAQRFVSIIQGALDGGKRWASFELSPTFVSTTSRPLF